MNGIGIVITIVAACLYWLNRYMKELRHVLLAYCVIVAIGYWATLMFISKANIAVNSYLIILYTFCSIVAFFYLRGTVSIKPIIIKAKQQTYWGIDSNKVDRAFKHLEDVRSNRVEVKIPFGNTFFTVLNDKEVLTPSTIEYYTYMSCYYPIPLITNVSVLEDNSLAELNIHRMIFKKLKELIKDKEQNINYNEILRFCNYRADFFLMALWDRVVPEFNLAIGQLEALVTDNIFLQEFINALDLLTRKSVKLRGSYLRSEYECYINGIKSAYFKDETDRVFSTTAGEALDHLLNNK